MVPKNESYVDIIGEGQSASFLDFQIVNAMYQCSGIPLWQLPGTLYTYHSLMLCKLYIMDTYIYHKTVSYIWHGYNAIIRYICVVLFRETII